MARIGVVLSGCGVQDGSEIHEAVLTLLALDRAGAEAVIMAPDKPQADVMNHVTGKLVAKEKRNVMVEAARIARGKIKDVAKVDAGELKFLAIATEKRSPDMPGVPTLKELGVNVVYDVNRGLIVPKGTPAEAIAKLGSACAAAAKEPAFAEAMKKQGTDVRYMDRATYGAWLKKNDDLNKSLAKDLGLSKR